MNNQRRRYLLAVGAVGAATIAGCSGSDSDTDGGETDSSETDNDTDPTPTEPTAETDSAEESDDTASTETEADDTAEVDAPATFRRYLEAYASGDRATVESLTHPESDLDVETEDLDLTLSSVERTTLSAIAEAESLELTEAELADARATIDDELASIGAEAYATVSYTAETDQYGEQSGYALLVRDDGQWYVYDMVLSYLYDAQ